MSRNFWNSAILRAGIKLDIFSRLESSGMSPESLAQRIGAQPKYLQAFLNASVALGLLQREENTYRNSQASSSFLIKGEEQYVGDLILHITNRWDGWGRLDQLVKAGRTIVPVNCYWGIGDRHLLGLVAADDERIVVGPFFILHGPIRVR